MNEVLSALRDQFPHGTLRSETTWNGAAFVAGLVTLARPYRVVEVGANIGVTSAFLANAIKENGTGMLLAYEQDVVFCMELRARLEKVWPGGAWEVVEGDFYSTVGTDPVDLAFIDIDPKTNYTLAYQSLTFAPGALIVAHDATLNAEDLVPFVDTLHADGWKTITLPWERGFLVAVKP